MNESIREVVKEIIVNYNKARLISILDSFLEELEKEQ